MQHKATLLALSGHPTKGLCFQSSHWCEEQLSPVCWKPLLFLPFKSLLLLIKVKSLSVQPSHQLHWSLGHVLGVALMSPSFPAGRADTSDWARASDSPALSSQTQPQPDQGTAQANSHLMMSSRNISLSALALKAFESIISRWRCLQPGEMNATSEHNPPSTTTPVSPALLSQWPWILVSIPPYHCKIPLYFTWQTQLLHPVREMAHPPSSPSSISAPVSLDTLSNLDRFVIFRFTGTFSITSLSPVMSCHRTVLSPHKTEATPSAISSNLQVSSNNWINHESLPLPWQLSYHYTELHSLHFCCIIKEEILPSAHESARK